MESDSDKDKYSKALGDDLEFLLGLSPAKSSSINNSNSKSIDDDFSEILEFSKIVNELEDLLKPEGTPSPLPSSSTSPILKSESSSNIANIEESGAEDLKKELEEDLLSSSVLTSPNHTENKLYYDKSDIKKEEIKEEIEEEIREEINIQNRQDTKEDTKEDSKEIVKDIPEEYVSLFDLNHHSDSESNENEKNPSSSTSNIKPLPRPRRPSSSHISIISDNRLRGDFSLQYEPPISPYQYIGLEPIEITHFIAKSVDEYYKNYTQFSSFNLNSIPSASITSLSNSSNNLNSINNAIFNNNIKLNDYYYLFPTLNYMKSSLLSSSNSSNSLTTSASSSNLASLAPSPISSSVVVHTYECVIRPDVSTYNIMNTLLNFLKKVLKFKVVEKIEDKEKKNEEKNIDKIDERKNNYNHIVVSRTRETTILLKTQASSLNYQAFASFFPTSNPVSTSTNSSNYNREWDTIDIQFALSPNMKQRVLVFQFIKKIEIISTQLSQQYSSASGAQISSVSSSSSFTLLNSLTTQPSTLTYQLLYMISDTLIKNFYTFSTLYHVALLNCCQCVIDIASGEYLEIKDEGSNGETDPKNILSLTEEKEKVKDKEKYTQQLVLINSSLHTFIPLSPVLSSYPQYYRGFDPHFLYQMYFYCHTIAQKTSCYNDFKYMIDYLNEEEKKMKGVVGLLHSMLSSYNIFTLSEKFDKQSEWKRYEEYEKHEKVIRSEDKERNHSKDLLKDYDPLNLVSNSLSSTFFPLPLLKIQSNLPSNFLQIIKNKLLNTTPSLSLILNNLKYNEENDSISLILSLINEIFSIFLLECDKNYTQEIQKINFLIISLIESIKQHQIQLINLICETPNIFECELMKSFTLLFTVENERGVSLVEDNIVLKPIKSWFSSFFNSSNEETKKLDNNNISEDEKNKKKLQLNNDQEKKLDKIMPEVNELVLYYCNCLIGKVMGKLFVTQTALYFSPYSLFHTSSFFSSSTSASVPSSSSIPINSSNEILSGSFKFRIELTKITNILAGDEIKSLSPSLTVQSSSPFATQNNEDQDQDEIEIKFSNSTNSSPPISSNTTTTPNPVSLPRVSSTSSLNSQAPPSRSSSVDDHVSIRTSSTSSHITPTIYTNHSLYLSIDSNSSVQFTLIATHPNDLKNFIMLLKVISLD